MRGVSGLGFRSGEGYNGVVSNAASQDAMTNRADRMIRSTARLSLLACLSLIGPAAGVRSASAQPPAGVEAASPPPQPRPFAKPRLRYIDNLRIVLISIMVLGHLAVTYGAAGGGWFYDEKVPESMASGAVLTLYTLIAQSFTLAFFMMISSYFNPPSYDRKGAGAFVKDKLKRLGLPLVFYWAVINPLMVLLIRVFEGQPPIPPDVSFLSFWIHSTSVGPMWFVEALLIFSLVYVLWRLAMTRRSREASQPRSPGQVDGKAPGNGAMALFALVVGLVTFAVRLAWPVDHLLEPLHFKLGQFPQYVAYFVVGIIAYRRNWFAGVRVAQARLWVGVAVELVVLCPVLIVAGAARTTAVDSFLGGPTWQSLVYSVWEQFLGLAMIVTLLVWFRERFNRQGRLAAAMGVDTYAVYLFHPLVIVPLGYALSGVVLVGVVKWVLVAPLALALCFLVAHLVRKLPLVRDVL
jgi:glucans biosynthesis protein C